MTAEERRKLAESLDGTTEVPKAKSQTKKSATELAKELGGTTAVPTGAQAMKTLGPIFGPDVGLTQEQRNQTGQEAMAALNGLPSAQAAQQAGQGTTAEGLAGAVDRGAWQGLATVPSMVVDPIVSLVNTVLPENMKGASIHDSIDWILTKLGVPEPRSATERILQSGVAGATGAGTMAGAGRMLAGNPMQPQSTITRVGEAIAANPGQQVAGGATGGLAQQTAAEAGAGPLGQMGANLLGTAAGGLTAEARGPRAIPVPAEALKTTDLKTLLRRSGSGAVQQELAQRLDVNPDEMAASQRLGMNLPPDIFSQNTQMKELAGVARGVRGSDASQDWANVLADSLDKADETLKNIGVVYENGKPSLPVVSANVLHDLTSARDANINAAKDVFKRVDEVVPKSTEVTLPNTTKALQTIQDEVGDQIYPQEKQLLDALSKPGLTYGGFIRIKNGIGEALSGQGPYADLKGASAARLYDALKEDQRFNVGKLGSPALVEELDAANSAYRQGKDLQDLVVRGFGENETGGIGSKLVAALDPSSLKKDSSQFNKAMEFVPEDLKGQAIATAIASKSRATSGDKSVFSPNSYADVYEGIVGNKDVAKEVFKNLPEGSYQFMTDLYSVSKAVRNAQNSISRTGASMQAFKDTLGADSLVDTVMNAATRAGAGVAGGAIGTAMAGPGIGTAAGAGAGYALGDTLIKSRPSALVKAGKLLRSEKFQQMAIDAATKKTAPEVAPVANSNEFKAFADSVGIPKGERYNWLVGALTGSAPQSSLETSRNKPKPMSALESNRAKGAQ